MKCPECKGDGWIPVFESGFCGKYACPTCRGTGEVTLTNEEWFCGLSTEEKANIITIIAFKAGYAPAEVVRKWVREWLQEEHRE